MNQPRIADRQPDSGKPTVRDERGAYGNVSYGTGYSGTYSGNAETDKPLPKVARAVFLPDSLAQALGTLFLLFLRSAYGGTGSVESELVLVEQQF